MGLIPAYRVSANGIDITALLLPRLVSLRVRDRAGAEADTLSMVLADAGPDLPALALPARGAELEVWLGYEDGERARVGLFIVDEVEVSGPPRRVAVKAKASPQAETKAGKVHMQGQKTRSWPQGTTFGALVAAIASEHGLELAVSPEMGAIALPHVDQVNESDANLLTRLARSYGGVAKLAGGKLALVPRGASTSASGERMPVITLSAGEVSTYRATSKGRASSGRVVAVWRDLAGAADVEASAGDGEPVRRLRHQFADRQAAQAAANAAHADAARGESSLSLTLPGRPELAAESRVVLLGLGAGVDGEWLVTDAEHKLDAGGFSTTVKAESPPAP